MISYYGGKKKIVKMYPKPMYNTIIEPFAGGAWYSLLYPNKMVLLNELYLPIYEMWDWLIHTAESQDIPTTPFQQGEDIRTRGFQTPLKTLIGFNINRGASTPNNIVQKWACQRKGNPFFASTTKFALDRARLLLPVIKHWEITNLSYDELPNVEATWFIDPPYQHGGQYYVHNSIDYHKLRDYVMSRKGQVIVCENSKADWLDFRPLANLQGQKHKTTEVIFTKIN